MNVVGPVITTNSRDSLFLPPDDRRYFVAWSTLEKTDFSENYWREFYAWLDNGGKEIVAHYLGTLDLSGFDPKAPPPKTRGWSQIVRSSCSPDDSDMRDALERLNNPPPLLLTCWPPEISVTGCAPRPTEGASRIGLKHAATWKSKTPMPRTGDGGSEHRNTWFTRARTCRYESRAQPQRL